MERMLRGAQQPVQVRTYEGMSWRLSQGYALISDADDSQDIETGWEIINDQYLLDTSALSERLTYVQELGAIYGHLGARLGAPFLDQVAKCCVANLTFKLDENVRMVSCEAWYYGI